MSHVEQPQVQGALPSPEETTSTAPESELHSFKISAETEKITKETAKLEEEIKALKHQGGRCWRIVTWLRDLIGIAGGLAVLFYGAYNFVDQQRERTKFEITKEIVTLVQQLSGDEQAQGNAAILLSAYGEHAIPVLLNALSVKASSGLIRALELVGQEKPTKVIPPLRERAAAEIQSVMGGEKKAIRSFTNYIEALRIVGVWGDTEAIIVFMRKLRNQFDCNNLQNQGDFVIDITDRRPICKKIDQACDNIQSGACRE